MKEPTQEQIKKFREWCGFKRLPVGQKGWHYERLVKVMNWLAPDQTEPFMSLPYLPRIDLNNLFKYAVPKLFELDYDYRLWSDDGYHFFYIYKAFNLNKPVVSSIGYLEAKDATFWALWQVKEKTNE